MKNYLPCLAIAATMALTHNASFAQTPKLEFPSASPACTLKQRVGLTDVEIVYSRPSAKGRQVFGNVVPFGKVWRTGANNATKITFSTPVKLNGHEVAAGSYALYTIPNESEWTIILNKGVGKSGTQYDEKDDVARFPAKASKLADTSIETFAIEFNQIRDESTVLMLVWEKTVVSIHLELDVTGKLLPQIEAAMAAEGGNKPYFQAAGFYYEHGQDLNKAKEWVDAAIKQREAYYIVHLKAKILAKLGDKAGATAAANRSSELAKAAKDDAYVKLNADLISNLK
ncbi:MAG: DUF2911 domain-containing protein [Verrucomicrobiota bacterium]